LGRLLLRRAEETARQTGFGKASLTVEAENERAIALYLRAGFQVVETISIEHLSRRIGYGGLCRMRKMLDQAASR
jgi:ribosomal protein S18 acetylase RimI-like enzyme